MFGFIAILPRHRFFRYHGRERCSQLLKAFIFLSLFVGFGIKAGVMPFHKWLPYAHSASPSNISALMSGVMIKVAIYGLVRYLVFVLTPDRWWGVMILIFARFLPARRDLCAQRTRYQKITGLFQHWKCRHYSHRYRALPDFPELRFTDLAMLALIASLFHCLNHALFQEPAVLTTGSVVNATGTRDIEKMGGLIKVMLIRAFSSWLALLHWQPCRLSTGLSANWW